MDELRETVRERYAAAATSVKRGLAADDVTEAACCAPANGYGLKFYDVTERGALPDEAVLASLGCGNPTAVADLAEGETVLDPARVAASTSCSPPAGSVPPDSPTAST